MPLKRQKRRSAAFAAAGQGKNVERKAQAKEIAKKIIENYRRVLEENPELRELYRDSPRKVDGLIARGKVKFDFPEGKVLSKRSIRNYRLGYVGGEKQLEPVEIGPLEAAKVQREAAPRETMAGPELANRVVEAYERREHKHPMFGELDHCRSVGEKLGLDPEDVRSIVRSSRKKGR